MDTNKGSNSGGGSGSGGVGSASGSSNMTRLLNGQMMLKYTNVVKGWQYRWFTVDAQAGVLSYYLCDNSPPPSSSSYVSFSNAFGSGEESTPIPSNISGTPRWQEHLAGAVITPSEEDSRTFTISCSSGDTLKLRATNARARQEWIDGLRNIAESHAQVMAVKHNFHRKRFSKKHFPSIGSHSEILPSRENADAFTNARQQIHDTELCNASLAKAIENIERPLSPTDPDVLMLKAVSAASTHCLLQCLGLLQRHHDISGDVRIRTHSEAAF